MESIASQLEALSHPSPADPGSLSTLAAWLEDRHLRQLAIEDREPLRSAAPGALVAFLHELGASDDLIEACKAGDDARVRRWLVALALHYEYGDNRETHETAAAATLAADAGGLIPANDPNLLALAELVGVQQPSDSASSTETLQAVLKAARQRPRPSPGPAPPQKRPAAEAASSSARSAPRPRGPLAGLSAETFPLGFETGSESLDAAARVLRMCHVRELRSLQDSVNRAIVCMQEFTANPKTDARLGRVGR